jgi:hypothetical protein
MRLFATNDTAVLLSLVRERLLVVRCVETARVYRLMNITYNIKINWKLLLNLFV